LRLGCGRQSEWCASTVGNLRCVWLAAAFGVDSERAPPAHVASVPLGAVPAWGVAGLGPGRRRQRVGTRMRVRSARPVRSVSVLVLPSGKLSCLRARKVNYSFWGRNKPCQSTCAPQSVWTRSQGQRRQVLLYLLDTPLLGRTCGSGERG